MVGSPDLAQQFGLKLVETRPALVQLTLEPTLLERLNFDLDSPFRGLVQTPTSPDGVVTDNSILKMLENSLMGGALRNFHHPATGKLDLASMLKLVNTPMM